MITNETGNLRHMSSVKFLMLVIIKRTAARRDAFIELLHSRVQNEVCSVRLLKYLHKYDTKYLFNRFQHNCTKVLGSVGAWVDGIWSWSFNQLGIRRGRAGAELFNLLQEISQVQLHQNVQDCWTWHGEQGNSYSVKEVRLLLDNMVRQGSQYETFWSKWIPKKILIFAWRAERLRLPVYTKLDERGVDVPSLLCPRCSDETETVEHAISSCRLIVGSWKKLFKWFGVPELSIFSIQQLFCFNPGSWAHKQKEIWQLASRSLAYVIWKQRNDLVFNSKSIRHHDLLFETQMFVISVV